MPCCQLKSAFHLKSIIVDSLTKAMMMYHNYYEMANDVDCKRRKKKSLLTLNADEYIERKHVCDKHFLEIISSL